jgi:hypothetical protein
MLRDTTLPRATKVRCGLPSSCSIARIHAPALATPAESRLASGRPECNGGCLRGVLNRRFVSLIALTILELSKTPKITTIEQLIF